MTKIQNKKLIRIANFLRMCGFIYSHLFVIRNNVFRISPALGSPRARPEGLGFRVFRALRGFTLIELIVYISLLALIAVVTTNTILILNKTIGAFRLERRMAASAETAMRRIVREAHLANDIHASSTLDVSPGILSLASVESEEDAAPKNVMLYVNDAGALTLRRATSSPMVLTGQNLTVTNLVFRQVINGTVSKSVKTELTLRAERGNASTTRNYYITTVLRGSY